MRSTRPLLGLLLVAASSTVGAAGVTVEVASGHELRDAIRLPAKHVVVRSNLAESPFSSFADADAGVVLPLQPDTQSIVGACGDAAEECTISLDWADYRLFGLEGPGVNLWVHNLKFVVLYADKPSWTGYYFCTIFDVKTSAALWLTNVTVEASGDPWEHGAAQVGALRALDVSGDSHVLVSDSEIKYMWADRGPLAVGRSHGTVTLVRTTIFANYANLGPIFDMPPEQLHLLNVTFLCNSAALGCVVARDGCSSSSETSWIWTDLENMDQGEGLCTTNGADFLNGTEPELLERMQDAGVLPVAEPTFSAPCATVLLCQKPERHASLGQPIAIDPQLVVGLLVVGITAAVIIAMLAACAWCSICGGRRRPRGQLDTGSANGDKTMAFVPPREVPCSCRVAGPGDERCLLCPQCGEHFTSNSAGSAGDRRPRALPCGHSICATCTKTIDSAPEYAACDWAHTGEAINTPVNYPALDMLPIAVRASLTGGGANPFAPALSPRRLSWMRGGHPPGSPMRPGTPIRGAPSSGPRVMEEGGAIVPASPARLSNGAGRAVHGIFNTLSRLSAGVRATARWRPDEESMSCPICWVPLSADAPDDDDDVDCRPVIFPCGHGACADCASRIRQRGVCYERCAWQAAETAEPFVLNKLMIGMIQLAHKQSKPVPPVPMPPAVPPSVPPTPALSGLGPPPQAPLPADPAVDNVPLSISTPAQHAGQAGLSELSAATTSEYTT